LSFGENCQQENNEDGKHFEEKAKIIKMRRRCYTISIMINKVEAREEEGRSHCNKNFRTS